MLLLAAVLAAVALVGWFAGGRPAAAAHRSAGLVRARGWLTTPDHDDFATALAARAISTGARPGGVAIPIDPSRRYQRVVGFGAALTASSADLLAGLPPARRTAALDALFKPGAGAGINVLRVVIGASDFADAPLHLRRRGRPAPPTRA